MQLTVNRQYTEFARGEEPSIEAVYTDELSKYIIEKHIIADSQAFEFRLAIKRSDKSPIRSWRILQDMKNAVVGAERSAIEVYPPESEVTDSANMYHLWVFKAGLKPGVSLIPPGT